MIPNDDDEVSLSSCSKPLFHVMVNPRADDEKLIGLTSVSQVKVNSAKKIMGRSSAVLRCSLKVRYFCFIVPIVVLQKDINHMHK